MVMEVNATGFYGLMSTSWCFFELIVTTAVVSLIVLAKIAEVLDMDIRGFARPGFSYPLPFSSLSLPELSDAP